MIPLTRLSSKLPATLLLVAALGLPACQSSMPIGVPPFPKAITLHDGTLRLCDREPATCGSSPACVDLAQYEDKESRNELQHALLSIATDHCHAYKMRLYGWTRFGLASGAFSHLTGAASAVIGHKTTSRTLAGIGTATSAIGGDFDSYFRESKLSIALSGIELSRTRVFKQIARQQDKALEEYPTTQAVNDALRYHQVCNLPESLSESAAAVENATMQERTVGHQDDRADTPAPPPTTDPP